LIDTRQNLVSLANSRYGPAIGILIAKILPIRAAYRFSDYVAAKTAKQVDLPLVMGIRANQSVIKQLPYDHPDLDQAVYKVLRKAGRGYMGMFKTMAGGREALNQVCIIDNAAMEVVEATLSSGRGLVYVGGHCAGFDQMILRIGGLDYPLLGLSYADPTGSYVVQNRIRERFGVRLEPISMGALKKAVKHLRQGGLVGTMVDRRDEEHGEELMFFGRPTKMPTGHARLAIRMGTELRVGGTTQIPDGSYLGREWGVFYPENYPESDEGVRQLSQDVLNVLEANIALNPDEWIMFFPTWPEVLPDGYPRYGEEGSGTAVRQG
jgi:KDO2-lipid IV(A) lauroyltransferase